MIESFEKRILLSPPHMSGKELSYIERAFHENWIVPLGPNVNEFEKQMVKYLATDKIFAVAMNSGTAAIHIALRLLNVQPGEEVFCSSATFAASANPIVYEKAIPVFIDSESTTWNLCPDSLLKAIQTKKKSGKIPRILICTDLLGTSADYIQIQKICLNNGIHLIEDSAEALGASFQNQKCGTFGDFGILSFNGNKIITTSGGGMLITHSQEYAEKALFLITQAREKAAYYLHKEIGYNYRLSNICAGIGIGQLQVLDDRVHARINNYNFYKDSLKKIPLIFKEDKSNYYSNRWLSAALIGKESKKTPADLISHLDAHNIEARHIWKPLHTQPVFQKCEFYHVETEPISEKIFNEGVCLPSGSSLTQSELEKISRVILNFF